MQTIFKKEKGFEIIKPQSALLTNTLKYVEKVYVSKKKN